MLCLLHVGSHAANLHAPPTKRKPPSPAPGFVHAGGLLLRRRRLTGSRSTGLLLGWRCRPTVGRCRRRIVCCWLRCSWG